MANWHDINIRKGIGELIRKAREDQGLTQLQVANMMDWTDSYISQIESGDTGVIFDNMVELLAKLLKHPEYNRLLVQFLFILADPSKQKNLSAIDTLIKSSFPE